MKKTETNTTEKNSNEILEIMPEQPKKRDVKDVLAEDAIMLKGMTFTMDEARKFFPIFAKLEEDLVGCVEAIEREEQKAKKAKEAKEHAEADSE